MGKEPKYLFHYTNIETLAYILKNKAMKFNSLLNVDDLMECKTKDLGDFGRFCYVSCWTDREEENIALWSMYSQRGHGIRIRMKANPFKEELYDVQTDKYIRIPKEGYALDSVTYVTGDNMLIPNVNYATSSNPRDIAIGLTCFVKNICWQFQNEWRYSLAYIPQIVYTEKAMLMTIDSYPPIKKEIYVTIDKLALEDMEILMGPMTDEADEIIVDALLRKFKIRASVKKSELKDIVNFK